MTHKGKFLFIFNLYCLVKMPLMHWVIIKTKISCCSGLTLFHFKTVWLYAML